MAPAARPIVRARRLAAGGHHAARLDGHMMKRYLQYAGKRVRFELDCAGQPGSREQALLTSIRNFAASEDLGLVPSAEVEPMEPLRAAIGGILRGRAKV